jgi:hypothetical protein
MCASPDTVTSNAFWNELHAFADAFSSGLPVDPIRASVRSIHSAVSPVIAVASYS